MCVFVCLYIAVGDSCGYQLFESDSEEEEEETQEQSEEDTPPKKKSAFQVKLSFYAIIYFSLVSLFYSVDIQQTYSDTVIVHVYGMCHSNSLDNFVKVFIEFEWLHRAVKISN